MSTLVFQGFKISGFQIIFLALTVQILLTCNEDSAVNTCITFCLNKWWTDQHWHARVNSSTSRSDNGGNMLRTFKLFKRTYMYQTEHYCTVIMPKCHRSAFAKFHCGVAPLLLETGRYEGLPVNKRICPFCRVYVENETHVIINWNLRMRQWISCFKKQ